MPFDRRGSVTPETIAKRLPGLRGLSIAFAAATAQVVVLALYLLDSTGRVVDPVALLFPFVWLNVGALGVWVTVARLRRDADARASGGLDAGERASEARNASTRTNAGDATARASRRSRQRALAAAIAGGYLLVLAVVGGVLGPGFDLGSTVSGAAASPGWYVSSGLPPGYGPAAVYEGALVTLVLVPYKLVGYVALAVLVYATVLDAASTAISGVLGLLSCVSCSWPILAALVSGLAGSGSAAAAVAYSESLGLSTAVFVVTVALLAWRPTIGRSAS